MRLLYVFCEGKTEQGFCNQVLRPRLFPQYENPGVEQLKLIADSVHSIEYINDGPTTAPSKRIIDHVPRYKGQKASAGPDIAEYIGLPLIRAKCPHFKAWLNKLEGLLK